MELIELHRRFRRHCILEEGLSVRTVDRMRSCFFTFMRRTDVESLPELTEEALRGFFHTGVETHQWSPSHYINHHKYLKRFLGWCVSEGLLAENPIIGIKRPQKPKSLPRKLSQKEAETILYSAYTLPWKYDFEQFRNHAIIAVFLYSGLRLSELLNLEMTDLDLNEGSILVRHGKGDKDRYVPIHFKLLRVLKKFIKDRKDAGKGSIYLFTGVKSNKPLKAKDVGRICRRISSFSGVSFTPHKLRHTFASLSIEQGLNVVKLKEIMGHSSINSTMIYLKISPKSLKEGLDELDMI